MANVRPAQGEQNKLSNHSIQMDRRSHAAITGVLDVSSFHENEIILKVDSGVMVITGENLHIGKLLLDDGKLDVEGHIDSVSYEVCRKRISRFQGWLRSEK